MELSPQRLATWPSGETFMAIRRIPAFVSAAIASLHDATHGAGTDAAEEAEFAFGFYDKSLEFESVLRAIEELRTQGRLRVHGPNGLGIIRGGAIEPGTLTREGVSELLLYEWNIVLQDARPMQAANDGSEANALECVPPAADPPGVPTLAIAEAFAGCHFTCDKWRKNLEDTLPAWLSKAMLVPGQKGAGGRQRLWNPVAIALALLEHQRWNVRPPDTKLARLTRAFSCHAMASWRDRWDSELSRLDAFAGSD